MDGRRHSNTFTHVNRCTYVTVAPIDSNQIRIGFSGQPYKEHKSMNVSRHFGLGQEKHYV